MISIIIPVYNMLEELAKCLASLGKQTYKDFEVVVLDDGSSHKNTENTKTRKHDLAIKFCRIEHSGAPRARNFGLEKSKGEYILFCDADMELKEDCLEKMLKALENNLSASYVYADFKYGWKKFKFWDFDADKLKQINFVNTCSLVRRQALDGVSWDESLEKFQDWDLWLSLLEKGKIGVYIPEVLFKASAGSGKISQWLPKTFYKLPFSWESKKKYEKWKRVVQEKHKILKSEV